MDKYIFKGLKVFQLIEDMAYRSNPEDLEVYRLTGMAKELEEQGKYKEAMDLYLKADKIYCPLHKEEMEELAREHGKGDYLLHAKLKTRICSCNTLLNKDKIKELESLAKKLEEVNPRKAIKIYEKLNILNPGLKKYNNRIKVCKNNFKKLTKKLESESKELEKTNPEKAIKIYHKLNKINPGLKKYDKRIEILERKLEDKHEKNSEPFMEERFMLAPSGVFVRDMKHLQSYGNIDDIIALMNRVNESDNCAVDLIEKEIKEQGNENVIIALVKILDKLKNIKPW